jgi:hypothetical protein
MHVRSKPGMVAITLVLAAAATASCSSDAARTSSSRESTSAASSASTVGPVAADFVVYATRSLKLGDADVVLGGDLGVTTYASPAFGPQLVLGDLSLVDPLHAVIAPSVSVETGAFVNDVQTHSLVNQGGHVTTLDPFPPAMPTLPLALPATPGTTDVTVGQGHLQDLAPGAHGALSVAGTVVLEPGTHSFSSVALARGGRLLARTGVADVRVAGSLSAGPGSVIAPATCQDHHGALDCHPALTGELPASNLAISVDGGDSAGGAPAAAVSEHSVVVALVAVPNGTLSLGSAVVARGAFAGFDVSVGDGTLLAFDSGLQAVAPQGTQPLHGYVSLLPDSMVPVGGPVDPAMLIGLDIGLPAQPGLQAFVADVSDPQSPNYRHYLDLPTFTQRFGGSPGDYAQLVAWAQSVGFTVTNTYPNNLLVRVTGTAAQIESALFTNLVWRTRPDASQFVTVDREPSLNLAPTVLAISGLDDFVAARGSGGTFPGNQPPTQNYWGADFRNAYFQSCLTIPGSGQPLDGSGQVVAVLSLNNFQQSDIQGYDGQQNPALNPANVVPFIAIAAPDPGGGIGGTPASEVVLDIEAVQSMAPQAQVLVFEESLSWEGHADALYHAIATTPSVTVATSSWYFSYSTNAQQAVWEMAAQGQSFFQHSGDFGNVGDPETNQDMDGQTIVGGTVMTTNPLTGPQNAPSPYPTPYLVSENTWVDGNGATGGGIMDGKGACYALESCPPAYVPAYQASVSMSANGGSKSARDFPDVAIGVYMGTVFQGGNLPQVGTSTAAPLWAGVAALINQRAKAQGAGQLGFANPTFYDIGLTSGTANDLYKVGFNDIQSASVNNTQCSGAGTQCFRFPANFSIPQSGCTCPPPTVLPGFPAVSGYDLQTGWGTPTCGLIGQVSTDTPLAPQTLLTEVQIDITTGKDDLRGDSAASALVFFKGQAAPVLLELKPANTANWDPGEMRSFVVPVPAGLNITPALVSAGSAGISQITFNLTENPSNNSSNEDNWDIGALHVRLFAPTVDGEMCQFDEADTVLHLNDTTDPGIVRLSAQSDQSGSGPIVTLTPTGCAASGSPVPAQPDQVQFIISTGNDTIRDSSDANVQVFWPSSPNPVAQIDLNPQHSGNNSGDVVSVFAPLPPNAPPIAQWQIKVNLITHNSSIFDQDDHWDVGALNVMTWSANQPERCVALFTGDPAKPQLGGTPWTVTPAGCPQ